MSALSRLQLTHFRNLAAVTLDLAPGFNLIHGQNGSGKTSLLEAIHVLATGKSFRSSLVDPLIMDGESEAVIHARAFDNTQFGLAKPRNQKHSLKLNGNLQKNWDEVARLLPTLVLDSGSFQFLEGGPKARRRFLDWGVFHVEPGFVAQWRRSRHALAHRNRLLKSPRPDESQLLAWDHELCLAAEAIDNFRSAYMKAIMPDFLEVYGGLAEGRADELTMDYRRGWDEDMGLAESLQLNRSQDIKYGASQLGPHRADLDIRVGRRKALEVLSRGQQKLLICALKIAQGKLLSSNTERKCSYLVDDLPAELDSSNRKRVLTQLARLDSQVFVSCVERDALATEAFQGSEMATFHVERGTITA
ncbi:MAG: DNA replication/repair protein RecF [Gammaproteobacteria bacterium]